MMSKDDAINKVRLATSVEDVQRAVKEFEKTAPSNGLYSKRTYIPPSIDDLKQRYATNDELRRRAMASKIPFIDSAVGDEFKLYQGLVLVGAVSGRGKSTNNANIIAGFLQHQKNKKALVVTNEENMDDVYNRIACIMAGLNFFDFRNGRLKPISERQVRTVAEEVMERVVVEDGSGEYDMTVMEDVQAALIHAAGGEYGLATFDYFQTVTTSREEPDMNAVQVSKKLGFFMKDYGRKVPIPVVMFVQLRESDDDIFKDRVENDRTVYNHAFMVVEVIPDFETKTSRFKFLKDRFGDAQSKEIEMEFQGGKFIPRGVI